MGELAIKTHWKRLVVPTCEAFFASEDNFINATMRNDTEAIENAAYEALRLGMSAAIFLYS